MRYLINLSYDGSKFYGYQIQKNQKTVAGELNKILSMILNENILTIGASRTDRNVHSLDQYCHFDTNKDIDIFKLKNSINKMIDKSIFIKNIFKVSNEFHSRYSVQKKEYIYKINMGVYNPIEKDYIFQYNKTVNKKIIDIFIKKVSGKHNFRSFTSDKNSKSYERDIKITYKIKNNILYLKFESSGFLRYMIRNIVGLLLDINDNKKKIEEIENIFKSKNRCDCGKCASSVGLYLTKIKYRCKIK